MWTFHSMFANEEVGYFYSISFVVLNGHILMGKPNFGTQ